MGKAAGGMGRNWAKKSGECVWDTKVVKKQITIIHKEVEEFWRVLRKVMICISTGGCSGTEIHAIEIARHILRTDRMEYRCQSDTPHKCWPFYWSLLILPEHEKYKTMFSALDRAVIKILLGKENRCWKGIMTKM